MEIPKFDPTQPFQEVIETPKFDPNQPFEDVDTQPTPESIQFKPSGTLAEAGMEGLKATTSKITDYGLEKIGVLSPEQMKQITQAPEEYKKARSFSDLLEKFQELGQQTREAGFEARRRGVESLKGLEPIRGQEIIPELGYISRGPIMELAPEELPQVKKVPSKQISNLENLLKQKESLQNKLGKLQETGIESIERNKEINTLSEKLSDINSKISQEVPEAFRSPVESIPPTLKDFEKATNIPGELLQVRPELANKKIQKQLSKTLKDEIDFLKTGSIEPAKLADYVRSLQEKTSYLTAPSEVEKFKQEIARNVSNYLKSLEGAEGYAKGQAQSQKAIQLEKGMREFGLGLDSENNIKITNPKKIENIYKTGNQKEIDRLNRYINQAQELQLELNVPLQSDIIPPNIDKFQTEFPLSQIKKTVEEAKDLPLVTTAKRAVGSAVGGAVGGIPGAIAGYTGSGLLPTGTKLQELASLVRGSESFKTGVKALGPLAGIAGAAAGGYFGYQEAKEEGLPDIAAYPYAAFEAVNPLPVSPIQAKKALETSAKGRAENIAESYKMSPEDLEKSKQRTEIIKEVLPSWMKKEDTKFKSSKPEDISDLLNKMSSMNDKAAVEYTRVLQQLVDAPESQKEAMLFSLNQQPAFKEIIRRIKNNE